MYRLLLSVTLVAFALGAPQTARAFSTATATFTDLPGGKNAPDSFSISSDAGSTDVITLLVIDLSTSVGSLIFDATTFVATAGSALTGFTGGFFLTGTDLVTLNFSDFNAGETFTFTVDLDDPANGAITEADVAGSAFTITAAALTSPAGAFVDLLNGTQAAVTVSTTVPEPTSAVLLALGLGGLGILGRRRAA